MAILPTNPRDDMVRFLQSVAILAVQAQTAATVRDAENCSELDDLIADIETDLARAAALVDAVTVEDAR